MTAECRCVADDRCVAFDRREGLAELVEDSPLCEPCLVAGERAVPLLVLDYRDLEQHIPPSSSRGDGQPRGSGEAPALIRVGVEAVQREIWSVLTIWEEVCRDFDRLSTPELPVHSHWSAPAPTLRPGTAVQRAARIIAPRVRRLAWVGPVTIRDYPNLDDDELHQLGLLRYADVPGWRAVVDFRRLHSRAMRTQQLDDAEPEMIVGVPCRGCDMKALYREPADETVRCGVCGDRYSAKEYRQWTKLLAAKVDSEGAA